MWQAREVQRLLSLHPRNSSLTFEIQTQAALGDKVLDKPLAMLAAAHPGIFTKELEAGLLADVYDVAVHSLKDVPTSLPPGLVLAGIGRREDPRDAFAVAQRHAGTVRSLADLPPGSVVGTSSLRREAMLRREYPGLRIVGVRGNLNTRIAKLDADPAVAQPSSSSPGASSGPPDASPPSSLPPTAAPSVAAVVADPATRAQSWSAGSSGAGSGAAHAVSSSSSAESAATQAAPAHYDALLLAVAGLVRMGWGPRITSRLPPHVFPYGVGQGSLGIEVREGDERAAALARSVTHGPSALRCLAERAFLNRLQGGCQVPIGVHSFFDNDDEGGEEGSAGSGCASATLAQPQHAALASGGKTNPMPSAPTPVSTSPSDGGCPSAPERVRNLTLMGSVSAPDGSNTVSGTVTEPVLVPDTDLGSPQSCITKEQWQRMCEDGARIGRALADRLLRAGAGDILGPLTAPRAITYGAAEQPLDR
jgi:porphobilinogen deaminase